uniref:ATP synthase subunit 8 n=1 Tax=Anthonomus rubi TaxID=201759 RepID=A0A5B8ZU48_9CUCU|nr:ATP synthase subunit 8 [Anthonomus rubi]QED56503.1 ATP synthase subunit 8 [Anthonomus rubi]QED56516.1 ATP synthase subunit 8 [Anthonomus rubi]QED56528.1 ATP synthase subunit 8 [Anthonomus rubi]QEH58488.1 ATP synthase subunit 8 [Anthonomus rubi]
MPQMAPLNWLSLYLFFFTLFILTIIINYYMFSYQPKISFKAPMKISFNWKW